MRRTEPFTSVQEVSRLWKAVHKNLDDLQSGGRELLVSGQDEKEDPLDFVLWKPEKKTASRSGMHRGAKDVRDGTSNARKCPENIWASRLTFMPAAKILFSRTMKMK